MKNSRYLKIRFIDLCLLFVWFYFTLQAHGIKFIKILLADKVAKVSAVVINSNGEMVTNSFFEDGKTIRDGFDYIHVDFNFKYDVQVQDAHEMVDVGTH